MIVSQKTAIVLACELVKKTRVLAFAFELVLVLPHL